MGLSVVVGGLAELILSDGEGARWFREEMEKVNVVLQRHGVGYHVEPEIIGKVHHRGLCSIPYSYLHYLRRIYALMRAGLEVTPLVGDQMSEEEECIVEEAYMMLDSHLLCHSDAEGYYVPLDFSAPLIDEHITGGILGSSVMLLQELEQIAPFLDISLERASVCGEVCADESHAFCRERQVWVMLYEGALASKQHQSVLAFM